MPGNIPVKRPVLFFAVIFCLATAALAILFRPLIRNLGDPIYREAFSRWVQGLGFRGIAILFGFQILQIIIAVIPGGPVELIAGAAYGAPGGTLICVAGCVVASSLIFGVGKKFGLFLAARFFGETNFQQWKFLQNKEKTAMLVFIFFLIPGTPKDMLTWFAPLSGLSLVRFVAVSVFARTPAIISAAIMGDSMIQGNRIMFAVIFGVTVLLGLLGFWFKKRMIEALKK